MSNERKRVIPGLEPLEDRVLLSEIVFLPAPRTSPANVFLPAPRTGGAAVQVGSTLEVAVASPLISGFGLSSTLILEDGRGDVAVEWDGLPPHFFSGINSITLNAVAPANVALLVSLGPLPSPQQVVAQMNGVFNAFVGLVPPVGGQLNVQTNPGVHTLVL